MLRKFYLSEPKKVDNRSQTQKAFVIIGNYLLGGSKKVINHGFRKNEKNNFAFLKSKNGMIIIRYFDMSSQFITFGSLNSREYYFTHFNPFNVVAI